MEKHLKYQFFIVIFLMIITCAISISFLLKGFSTTKNIYQHPYTVSNKLQEIKLSVHQIHLAMQTTDNVNVHLIEQGDASNKSNIDNISAQYLGDKDIDYVEELYSRWLLSQPTEFGQVFTEDKLIFDQLMAELQLLSDATEERATSLYGEAGAITKQSIIYIGLALLLAISTSVFFLYRTLADLRTIRANRKQYLYLIDQNVMITAIEDDGNIFDISNRLCRFLSQNKDDLIGKQLKMVFFNDAADLYDEMWNQVSSGAAWHGEIEVSATNSNLWLGIDVLPMQNSDYSYSGYRLLASDITHRKSLEKISITDAMTGLLNRRTLDETIERQTALAHRHKTPIVVGVFDVDFFKQYNDNYGHIAGDKALIHLSTVVGKILARPSDFVFRIGGEEFCFIFQCDNEQSSEGYVEKMREAVRNLQIVHKGSGVDKYLTISIGAVFYDGNDVVEGKVLLSDADDNLYRAKENRNQAVQSTYGQLLGIEPTID